MNSSNSVQRTIRLRLRPSVMQSEALAETSREFTAAFSDELDLEKISLEWEKQTGYDSIATIKRVYDQTPNGAYKCVWPDCKFVRKDAAVLWKHVHTGHGTPSLPPNA